MPEDPSPDRNVHAESSWSKPLAYESERMGAPLRRSRATFTDVALRLLLQAADDMAFGAHTLRQRFDRA